MPLSLEERARVFKQGWRSVGTRILLGYLLVIGLIGSISVMALAGLYQINASFDVLASNTVQDQALVQAISEQTLNMRYFAHRYIHMQAQQDKAGFETAQKELRSLLGRAWTQAQTEERQNLLRQISEAETRYAATFDSISKLIYERESLRSNVLEVQGLRLETAFTALRVGLLTNSDPALFLYFNNAQYSFQAMRLYVSRYLLLGNEGDMTLALAAYQSVLTALHKLESEWPAHGLAREFERAFTALATYHEGALEIQQNYQALNQLMTELDTIEPEITNAALTIQEQALDTLEKQSESTRTLVRSTRSSIWSGVLIAMVLALFISFSLTRSITAPLARIGKQASQVAEVDLQALTAQLDSLSKGDLRLNLHFTAQSLPIEGEDEIWLMARAFNSIIASLHQAESAFGMMAQYLNTMAATANQVAQRQLDVEVPVYSEQDTLGLALRQMLINLRTAYAEIAQHIARLEALYDINLVITTTRDLERVMETMVGKAVSLLAAQGCGVIFQEGHQVLHVAQGDLQLPAEAVPAQLRWMSELGKPYGGDDPAQTDPSLKDFLPAEVQLYYAWPLLVGGQCRGLLYLFPAGSKPLEQICKDFMANLVEQLRIAVEYIELVKLLEQRVAERTAELEAQKEEVKRFAYIVSHDLRAPLVNLKGFASELRSGMREFKTLLNQAATQIDPDLHQQIQTLMDEDVNEALEFIETSVNRMDRFINALLKLSRLGRQELNLEAVDMSLVVRAALESLSHQLKEREVTVEVGPLPVIQADRTAMEQVIGNLLDNAVKYLRRDRPGYIRILAEEETDRFVFHVQDNGRGIAEKDMDKVFMPFRRVGVQDTQGEGMGLPYVQALVRRHAGEITCQSVLGEGTTFSFYISKSLERH